MFRCDIVQGHNATKTVSIAVVIVVVVVVVVISARDLENGLSRHAFFFFPPGKKFAPIARRLALLASPANKAYLRNITESIYLYIRFDFSSLSFFGGFLAA